MSLSTLENRLEVRLGIRLSHRETELLFYSSRGYNSSETADKLHIKASTVKSLKRELYRKLGFSSIYRAVIIAYGMGWLENNNFSEYSVIPYHPELQNAIDRNPSIQYLNEKSIMTLLYAARGHDEKETARKMGICPATVKQYRGIVSRKLGFKKGRIAHAIILGYVLGWWNDEKYLKIAPPFHKQVEGYLKQAQSIPVRQSQAGAYVLN